MPIPPSLIGLPVAFLPVPMPQTDFVADAVPEPTGAAAPAPRRPPDRQREYAAGHAHDTELDLRRSHQVSTPHSLASSGLELPAGGRQICVRPRSRRRQTRPPRVGCERNRESARQAQFATSAGGAGIALESDSRARASFHVPDVARAVRCYWTRSVGVQLGDLRGDGRGGSAGRRARSARSGRSSAPIERWTARFSAATTSPDRR